MAKKFPLSAGHENKVPLQKGLGKGRNIGSERGVSPNPQSSNLERIAPPKVDYAAKENTKALSLDSAEEGTTRS